MGLMNDCDGRERFDEERRRGIKCKVEGGDR